jgi:hypothetical protein
VQAPSAHRKGWQFCMPRGRQFPIPSQVPAVASWSPEQDGGRQMVSAGYSAQRPKPSQVPVCPQQVPVWSQFVTPPFLQMPRGSWLPGSVDQQVPTRPT